MSDYSIPGLMTPEIKTKSGSYHVFNVSRDPYIVIPLPTSFKDTPIEDINFSIKYYTGSAMVEVVKGTNGKHICEFESEEVPSGKIIRIFWQNAVLNEKWTVLNRDFRVQISTKDNAISSLVFLKLER